MKNTPTYIAYHVRDTNAGETGEKPARPDGRSGGRGIWTRIGAAWANKDGKGLNLVLDLLPIDGRLVLREPMEKDASGDQPAST